MLYFVVLQELGEGGGEGLQEFVEDLGHEGQARSGEAGPGSRRSGEVRNWGGW